LITNLNGSPVSPALPAALAPFFFNAPGTFDSSRGATFYAFNGLPLTYAETISPGASQGGGTASFDITSLEGIVPQGGEQFFEIVGLKQLDSNTTAFDFSQFGPGGPLNISLQIAFGDFTKLLLGGQDIVTSASFSQHDPPTVVPEPASLAIWVMVGIGGILAARWRFGAAQSVA